MEASAALAKDSSPAVDGPPSLDSAVGEELGLKAWTELKTDPDEAPETCETYLGKLVKSVEERLVKFLQGEPAVGGVDLKGRLLEQGPLTMESDGFCRQRKSIGDGRTAGRAWDPKVFTKPPGLFSGFRRNRRCGKGQQSQLQPSRME